MKVIDVRKRVVSGEIKHYLVVDSDSTDDEINNDVEDWCESDPSGTSYGYSYNWSVVDDKDIIDLALKLRVEKIEKSLKRLQEEKEKIERYLK